MEIQWVSKWTEYTDSLNVWFGKKTFTQGNDINRYAI